MSAQTIEILRLADNSWTVDGKAVEVPEGRNAEGVLLAYASANYPPGTVASMPTAEGGIRRITLRSRPTRKQAPAPAAAPARKGIRPAAPAPAVAPSVARGKDLTDQPETEPQEGRSGRRALMIVLVGAALVLALAAVLIVPRLAGSAGDQAPAELAQVWEAEPVGGPVTAEATQVAGAGVLVNVDGGAAEAYRLDGGDFIGSALAPEGARIGVGPEFMVLATAADGTSSGAVITPDGVTPFSDEPGALIRRGTVPFLAGGEGAEQFALTYQGGAWERVDTPTPGLAPLAATESSVVWLGTGRTLTLTDYSGTVTSESTLETPPSAVEATQRAFVTDSLIGVVWTAEDGTRELITHSLTTGEVLERSPVGADVFDKRGAAITSTSGESSAAAPVTYWQLSENTPQQVTGPCPDPIPSGGTAWCATGDSYTDSDGATLPEGTRPIPSTTTDTTPALSGQNLALYSR